MCGGEVDDSRQYGNCACSVRFLTALTHRADSMAASGDQGLQEPLPGGDGDGAGEGGRVREVSAFVCWD